MALENKNKIKKKTNNQKVLENTEENVLLDQKKKEKANVEKIKILFIIIIFSGIYI